MKPTTEFTEAEWKEICQESAVATYAFLQQMPKFVIEEIIKDTHRTLEMLLEEKLLLKNSIKYDTFPKVLIASVFGGYFNNLIELGKVDIEQFKEYANCK